MPVMRLCVGAARGAMGRGRSLKSPESLLRVTQESSAVQASKLPRGASAEEQITATRLGFGKTKSRKARVLKNEESKISDSENEESKVLSTRKIDPDTSE